MKILIPFACAFALASPLLAQSTPSTDVFAFSEGGRLVQVPADSVMHAMDSSPLNLIDGSTRTDWTGEAGQPIVFVIELEERTQLSRVAFDTEFLNRDEKSPRSETVEISDESRRSGYTPILNATLKMNKDGQSFSFDPKNQPVGRWVRLTIKSNYGDANTGFTGFHGYGRQLTDDATLPNVTGQYEGWSGWGTINLKQQGNQLVGCYTYQSGQVTGPIHGRVLILDMTETASDVSRQHQREYFSLSSEGHELIGFARDISDPSQLNYATYMSAERRSARPQAYR